MNQILLHSLVCSLIKNELSEHDLNRFVQETIKIAEGILRDVFWRQLIIFKKVGYRTEALAGRCIEDLFLPKKKWMCYELRKYFLHLGHDAFSQTDDELIIALRKLVCNKVHQTLFDIAGEIDPVYKKVLRNVNDVIRQSGKYKIVEQFNEKVLTRIGIDPLHSKPEYLADELLARLFTVFRAEETTEQMLEKIFSMLEGQKDYRRELSINTLAEIIRDWYFIHASEHLKEEEESNELFKDEAELSERSKKEIELSAHDHQDCIQTVVLDVSSTILQKYVAKKHLSIEDRLKYEQAIGAMLKDLQSKSVKRLYDYFKEQFPNISYEEYRKEHRKRFEYSTSAAKEIFFEKCK